MDEQLSSHPICDPPQRCYSCNQTGPLVSPTLKEALMSVSRIRAPLQWFGVDIGGTLVKCVYFETQDDLTQGTTAERDGVASVKKFIKSNLKYGSSGRRDQRLEMSDHIINSQRGTLHFIKFSTSRMDGFFDMVTKNGLSKFPKVVCATGGGAFKFEKDFKERLGISLHKHDEMQCLIQGVHYLCHTFPDECYHWEAPNTPDTRKVATQLGPDYYPYILVNIGSGVSILQVESRNTFKRIGGTSVGGGTFQGLCAMLAGTDSFEESLALAEKGDNTRVDKLVKDIYGGDYNQFGLPGELVASSFGHMVNPELRKKARPEDLAKSTLVTVTNNIGAIARMCASISGIERVVFVGNYLCGNHMSMQMLSYAMEYWSQGTMRALFLEHEGYFGAVGSMLMEMEPNSPEMP